MLRGEKKLKTQRCRAIRTVGGEILEVFNKVWQDVWESPMKPSTALENQHQHELGEGVLEKLFRRVSSCISYVQGIFPWSAASSL